MSNPIIKKIENLVCLGFDVKFSKDFTQFKISLEKDGEEKSQMLPLEDHVTEDRIVGCLELLKDNFMKKKV
jgi:hypothetical protein